MKYRIDQIIDIMKKKGFNVFEKDYNPYNLNLIGIRSDNRIANSFDDFLYVIWKYQGKWEGIEYQITTDPGNYWLDNPERPEGTAILKEGQYPGLWQIGLHRGLYPALVQKNPCIVYRDNDRDHILDTDVATATGIFGINCHKVQWSNNPSTVEKASAGCQVFQNSDTFDNEFMPLIRKASAIYGNSFTYTLILEKDFKGA